MACLRWPCYDTLVYDLTWSSGDIIDSHYRWWSFFALHTGGNEWDSWSVQYSFIYLWFRLIKLFMFWVWGTCPPLYKLFPLRYFCGLYDLNSLLFSFFLWTQAFTLKPRSMLSMSIWRLGDDHSTVIFYYKADDASSLLRFIDHYLFSASNLRAYVAENFRTILYGSFLIPLVK